MRDGGHGEEHAYPLTTLRLLLRQLLAADRAAVEALAENPAVALNLCATYPAEVGRSLAIVEHRAGRIVGAAGYGVTGLGSGVEISVWIGEPFWGRGFATEVAHALI